MDSKVIIAIIVVAALVIGGGVALVMMGSSDNGKKDVVTYYGNGGTYDGKSEISSPLTTVQLNPFTNGEKAFTGWNTQKDGKGKDYKEGDTVALGTKLYAQWSNYKLTIMETSYVLKGLSAYITDDTRTMESIGKFTIPLSDSGSAMITYTGWSSVELVGDRFVGKVGSMETTLTIKVSGDSYHEFRVSEDGKMAMVYFEYNQDVIFE